MYLYEKRASDEFFPLYGLNERFVISTSAFGTGQTENSNQTPLGLHRVARRIGGGHIIGTVFRSRVPVGLTWQGMPEGTIAHRILWLEGLEPGRNSGGDVDSFRRYIYIHGFGDELTLGRPTSHGCIHMAAKDLIRLYDQVPEGTLVWIAER
jgi:lipoprotein-anchoring transpeptidase ErfK/SrfK